MTMTVNTMTKMVGEMEEQSYSGSLRKLLTTREVARILRLTLGQVRFLARTGQLPAIRVGRDWRYDDDAIQQWVERRRNSYQR